MKKQMLSLAVAGLMVVGASMAGAMSYKDVGPVEGRLKAVYSDFITIAASPANVSKAPESNAYPSGDFSVRVEGGTYGNIYRILGDKPLKWVQQTDFQNEEAVGYLGDRLEKLGVENELYRAGAVPGATVVIGEGDGIVFDWEPSVSSTAELMTAPRGTDPRLLRNGRRTTSERRDMYHDMMDAKADARAELEAERIAERYRDQEDAE